jgi:hypothetical protein
MELRERGKNRGGELDSPVSLTVITLANPSPASCSHRRVPTFSVRGLGRGRSGVRGEECWGKGAFYSRMGERGGGCGQRESELAVAVANGEARADVGEVGAW